MEYTVGTYVVAAIVAAAIAYALWRHGHKTGKDDAHDTIGTVAEAVVDHINDFVVDRHDADRDAAMFRNTVIPASQAGLMPAAQPVEEVNHYVKQGAIGTLNAAIETANAVKPDADEHLKEAAKTAVALAVAHAKDVTGDTDKGKDD